MKIAIILTKVLVALVDITLSSSQCGIQDAHLLQSIRQSAESNECITVECLDAVSKFEMNMNKNVKPCDNFYEFACGKIIQNTNLREEETYINSAKLIKKSIMKSAKKQLFSLRGLSEDHHIKLLEIFYRSCVGSTIAEEKNFAYLSQFKIFNNWPVIIGHAWNETEFDWKYVASTYAHKGFHVEYLFKLSVEIDAKSPSKYILSIDRPVLGLQREYFPDDTFFYVDLASYKRYMMDVVYLLGADKDIVEKDCRDVIEFERDLLSISLSNKQRRDIDKLYNKISVKTIINAYPELLSLDFLNKMLNSVRAITIDDYIVVNDRNYLTDINNMLKGKSKRSLANFIYWKMISQLVPFLSEDFRSLRHRYIKASTGQELMRDIQEACAIITRDYMPIAFGAFYVKYIMKPVEKKEIHDMVKRITNQFRTNVKLHNWVDNESKQHMLRKIDAISFKIGPPEEFNNSQLLADYYELLTFNSDPFIGHLLKLNLFNQMKLVDDFTMERATDVNSWYNLKHSAFVNSYYYYDRNQVELPDAVFQDVFFGNNRPRYLNYGAVGSIIGHEMVHALDDIGRQYDENRFLQNFWSLNGSNFFQMAVQCVDRLYSVNHILDVSLNIDGYATLNENIADIVGVRSAYMAYQELNRAGSAESNFKPDEYLLAMNYTFNQLFWISYATTHCTKYSTHELYNVVRNDHHAPAEFRVNTVLSILDEFANDFNCEKGDAMKNRDQCKIW